LRPKIIEKTERLWEMAVEKSIPVGTAAYVVAGGIMRVTLDRSDGIVLWEGAPAWISTPSTAH
jgi:hypothetical protein